MFSLQTAYVTFYEKKNTIDNLAVVLCSDKLCGIFVDNFV